MRDLPLEQPRRLVRLRDVVDAGAAAAPVRFGEVYQRDAREQPQQGSWLFHDPLPVREVTRVVIGDRDPRFAVRSSLFATRTGQCRTIDTVEWRNPRRPAADGDEPLVNVADLRVPGVR